MGPWIGRGTPPPGPGGHVVLQAGAAATDAQAVREDAENETFVEAAYPSEG